MIELAQRTLPQPEAPGEHPLSEGQRALWVLDRMDPAAAACHLAGAARIRDGLDAAAVGRALEQLAHRHPALRTTFETRDGTPVRRVHAWLDPDFTATDLDDPGQLSDVLVAEAWRPFHLEQGPLWRVRVVRLPAGEAVLLLAIHHLIADFASVSLLLRDLLEWYREEGGGEPARLVASGPGMTEWIARQEGRLAGPGGTSLRDFWLRRLGGELAVVELPVDRPRPVAPTWRGIAVTGRLENGAEALRAIGRSRGATLFAAVAAGLQAVLHRWTGEGEVLVGVPAARRGPGFAAEVGYFVNPVVLRLGLPGGEPGFADLVEAAGGSVREALAHGAWPFPRLARDLHREADAGRSLLRVLAVLQPARTAEERALAPFALGEPGARATLLGLELESIALPEERVQNDLLLMAVETEDGGLALSLRLDADLFDPATAGRLLGHLKAFLETAMAEPEIPVAAIDLLSPAERLQLEAWSAGPPAPPPGPCLHELIAEQATRTPEATALVHGDDEVTYRELRQRTSELADRLRGLGVGPEVRVGVCAGRTPELVVGLLSVLESGGAYVPLDPAWPTERLTFLLEDSGAALMLTDGASADRLPATDLPRVRLDGWEGNRTRAFPPWHPSSRNLAYLIYTSGSTGRPKAVAIEHRSAVTLALWARSVFSDRELDGVLASTSIGFDLSVFELLVPLCHGGRVVLAGSVLDLPDLPSSASVRLVNTVPSALAELLAAGALPASVETVNLAGEPLRRELVRGLFDTGVRRVLNLYGPSEDTTYSTWSELVPDNMAEPSIGRPIAGTQARVLDARLRPVPPGVAGELFLGGAGLARGYLGRPDLTADRFIPSPFEKDGPGARLYRTGDRARFRPNGELEFLGRLDDQVKIRGFRIEPGEVEAVLEMHPEVGQAVVLALGNGGKRRLVAYVAPRRPLTPWPPLPSPPPDRERGNLRSFLATRLPDHLIPSAFVFLEAFPRTPNGKVDRKALAVLGATSAVPAAYEAPRNPLEAELAAVWAEVLEREQIGVHDDFFDLGGHSLLAVRVQARLQRRLGVDLPLSLLLRVRTVAGLAVTLAAGLLPPVEPIKPINPVLRKDPLPLSFGQQRLWFLHGIDPLSPAYNMAGAWRLSGFLDLAALAQALGALVRRHESLRTRFAVVDGQPVQIIGPPRPQPILSIDLRALPEDTRHSEVERLVREEARRPFDLFEGGLLRTLLLRLAPESHLLVVNLHHIIADGWSVGVLYRDFAALYDAFATGRQVALPELPVQYADFALWQRSWLTDEVMERELAWWRERLANLPPSDLPADRPRPAIQSFRGAALVADLPAALTADLRTLSQGLGATFFMTLLAGFEALVHRLTGLEDVIVGAPTAGRNRSEMEGIVGFFVNPLVLRTDLSGKPSFRELVARVRDVALVAYEHQAVPFDRLVEELAPQRGLGRQPLFQQMFQLLEMPPSLLNLEGLFLERVELDAGTALYDLALDLSESPDGSTAVRAVYSTDLFDAVTIRRMVEHFGRLLAGAAADPDLTLAALPRLSPAEIHQALVGWNDHADVPKADALVHEAFAARAAEMPEAIAVVCGAEKVSYGELKQRADGVARHLRGLGVGPEDVVVVGLARSVDLVAALLGVLAAGAVYLPIEPDMPSERRDWMLADAGATLLDFPLSRAGRECVWERGPGGEGSGGAGSSLGDALAYLIYTSGSTGQPKGVGVPHRALAAHVRAAQETYGLTPQDVVLQFAATSFDVSLEQLLPALAVGARVVLRPDELWSPAEMLRHLAAEGVTVANLPTAYWHQLAREAAQGTLPPPDLRLVIAGGEAMQTEALRRWRQSPFAAVRLLNAYGPTETIVTATAADLTVAGSEGVDRVPIGRALAGRALYVLDGEGGPVPIGVAGELFIGGPLLARGYLGRPDLTAERFLPDSFSTEPGARLYRTGDLVRRLGDGRLEFAGRADRQLKVRGFRIEPGEIEAVLASHPAVREVVVVARDERLVAYVTTESGTEVQQLGAFAAGRLPAALVPADVVLLDELPLTSHGKVDLAALPAPERTAPEERFVPPRTSEERAIARIWAELLGVERVGIEDDFFALGGHSLLATQVLSRVRQVLGVELELRQLFAEPTVAGLAARVRDSRSAAGPLPLIEPVERTGALPLSFGQQRLWFLHRMDPLSPAYNMAGAWRLSGRLDLAAFAQTLGAIVHRHEVLRTTYAAVGEEPVQVIHPPAPFVLPVVDLAGLPAGVGEPEARRLAFEEADRPFDLVRGPMLRASVVRLAQREHLALLTVHHIACDGWSVGLLLRELESPSTKPLPLQYADFAAWQRRWLDGPVLQAQLGYWRQRLADAPAVLELPTDRPRPAVRSQRGARHPVTVPAPTVARLNGLARSEGMTLYAVLLALFQALLGRLTGEDDLVVGTPVAGRRQVEVENLIGFFVNTLALRADLRGDPPLHAHLEQTRTEMLEAFSHQDLPFERLVEELRPERSLSHTPVFQVLFALQNAPGGPLKLPGLRVEPLPPAPRAPFDLELDLAEQDGALVGSLGFAVDLFDEATAGRMVGHWVAWLEGAVERVEGRISELPVLRGAEVAEIVRLSRRLRRDREGELLELFEAQVARTPDAEAVLSAGVSLTYAELERRSNRLARHLAALGAGPGEIVAVQLERSPDLAVALLGVLAAGAAYLPLDPSLPAERAAFLMRDSGARILVDAGMLQGVGEEGPLPQPPEPRDLAYVIYTSGTTGAPKGVMVEHGSLLATLRALLATFRFEPGERMPSIAPYSFDIFLFELLGPLLTGGSVKLLPLRPGLDLDVLLEELESAARFHAVPAVLRQIVDRVLAEGISACYDGVREIYTGGDLVPPELLGDARRAFPSARISVLYGPTEGTIVCAAQVDAQASSRPLLGQPLPGAVLELRDRFGNLVPLGVTGEIHLGGPGVARGYLGKSELTAERFVPAPDGSRSYRTGDLARRLPDGTLEFLGRADRQVKIRGIRIEPGEVESRLVEHPGVREAVVVVQDALGERRLAAFFVPVGEAPSPSELRAHLARFLPAAMLPAAFVALDELPLTPNAKVDRNALAAWSIAAEAEESAAPRTPEEEIVAGLWAELLGVEKVGVREDVFERGAHSLLVTRMASRLRETFGIELPLRALFEEPTPAGLAQRIAEARTTAPGLPLQPLPRGSELPLSFAQQRLWFVDQMEPGNPLYNLTALLRLRGQLDAVALERAFTEVVRRHEALRTTFPATRGRPRQEIAPPAPFRLPLVDLTGLERRDAEARRQGLAEARRPFDLVAGPLLRSFLLRLDPLEHLLVLNVHHIVSDGWSTGILVKEVGALYGGSPSLPELPVQYADFAVWQREQLAGEALETQLAWWRRRLADAPPLLELPTDRPRPPVRGVRGSDVPVRLSAGLSEALARLGRREGATLFMTLLAAFQALLHRETGESDLSVGTPIAGRGRIETERLIGFFVNTLVMRADVGGSPSFRGLIAGVREAALEAYAHQDLPFEKLVEELVPQRDAARTPLFQVFFALDDQALDATGLPGLEMVPLRIPSTTAKFDLSLALTREPAGLSGSIEYSTDLFDRTTVQRLARRFERLVRAAVEDPETFIDILPLLAEEERHQVAVEWAADTQSAYPRESCIHELFEEQAARTPDLPAVSRGGGDGVRLTYAELNDRANGLARHLAACGVVPDSLVAVLQERSPDLVVTLLAILKAGGAYVPLDPAYPVDRLAFMLRDSGARILIADTVPDGLDVGPEVRILNVQREGVPPLPGGRECGWERGPGGEGLLAYVLYTSGSTGRPKAVGVPHRAVVRLVRGQSYVRRIGPGDRLTQLATASFDGATFEIWSALLSGAELVVVPLHRASLEELGSLVEREAITTLWITASLFHQMVDGPLHKLAPLRQLLTGGEVVSAAHVRRFLEALPGRRVVNGYGPTENTVFTCCHPVDAAEGVRAPLPIGRPIANTRVYLLDGEHRPVPLGVAGELFTGGDGLARGYLGRPDLTAERFVPDPFGEPGSRLYRTGDRARWLADGTVEFLGRLDAQVKLRGFRVEPGEVEAAVAASPGIERAAVLARQEPTGLRLVAYVVPASGSAHDTAALRAHLRGRLPEHMVPSAFVWLDALPLTENGKVDRRALARIAAPAETGTRASVAPHTPIEEGLAGIWRDVLGVAAAGRDDDFFELGGHSLLATQVVSRVREAFSVELPLRDLFATPRLADLAAHIEEEHRRGAGLTTPPVMPMPREGGLPLSFGQEWMWVADQLDPEAVAYNASIPVRLRGPLDSGALAAALREVARRHEILHTRFVVGASGPVQVPDPSLILPLALADLGGLPAGQSESEATRLAAAEAERPFDLAAGPPARALLVRLDSGDHLLLLSLHHLVTDGWSAGVLLREAAALLSGLPLPELPVQYGDFAVWQRQWLSGETLETLLSWWREHLAGPLPILELPADRPGSAPGGLGERLPFRLDPGPTEALRAMARGRGSTLFAVLLAAFKTLLARIARQDDLVVGTPVANRTRRELEGLIGYFVNDLPLRTRIGGDPTFLELLDRVHETALGAWAHQDLPLRRLAQDLGATAPLFRAWFQLQNTPLPSVELPGVKLALHELEAPTATFDLELLTREVDAGLAGHLVYNRELFRRDTAAALLRSFLVLIEGIAIEPGRRLSDLPLLAPAERHALLYEKNPSGTCAGATTLHAAFEAVAAAHPEAPAVTCEGVSLTYHELSQRADALARHLRRLGIGPESRVGLRLERSLELVVGILGVLKAGGAYVPLDPDYPRERLELLLEDARVHAMVTWGESGFSVSDFGLGSSVDGEVGPDHLAYVIYTSGSTGRPKGVMVTHRQAARLFEATRWFGFGPEDVWTLFHSYAFDFSVWELWGALLHGGRLVVVPRWVSRSPEAFLDLLVEERVTVLNQTPSAFYQLVRAEEGKPGGSPFHLRWVIFGGEALEPPKLLPWFDRHGDARPALVNMYGITETTVHVTLRPLERADADSLDSVLGQPLDDLRLYLLDPAFGPVPAGAVGEIFVGGGGVARGYLGRPDLTAERFVPDPFSGDPGARLYRSGDLARRRPDGELAYLGRADQQLKVRGFRIEPGEIEAALVRHPAIAQAAVIVRKLSAEDVRLVACFVPRAEAPAASELREHLLAMLPEPWVPGLFVPVAALPLTAHGKVDRRALAETVDASTAVSSVKAGDEPLTPLEGMLAALWADLLEVDRVGRDDNFFALGGHSLLMTRIAARVREAFGVAPPMRSFFERPTVAHLAIGVLGEVAGRLGVGRVGELVDYVQGLPEAEVGRLVARKKDLTPRPPLPSPPQPPGEGAPPPKDTDLERVGGSPSPGGWGGDGRGGQGVRSLRVRDLLATLPPAPPPPAPRLRVETLAVPTFNRPEVLERGLTSYAEAAREHGRALRFAILDDSRDPAIRDDYRRRLSALRRRFGVEILYAGAEEKRRFAADLVAEGIPPAAVTAALSDPENVGVAVGANRNAVLLQTVGEGVLSVDDDTLARGGLPPENEPGIAFLSGTSPGTAFLSGRDPGAIRGFGSRAEALAAIDLLPVDLPGIHESLLGRDLGAWLSGLDPEAPVALDPALDAGGRILVTTNGWVGDCGWRAPTFYMLLEGDSWRRLVRSAEAYRTVTASKEIVRFVPRPTVGNGDSFMATLFTGLDNRHLLPPFPPVLWGEDLLFGITLQLAFPAGRVGHLPWVAAHEPVEQRAFWPGEMVRSASGVDHSRLVSALLDGFAPDLSETPSASLRRLGAFLQDLGRMDPAAFDELARRSVRRRAEAFAAELEARLEDLEGGLEAEELWAADVRRYLDLLRRHLADLDFAVPLDLLYGRDPEEAWRLAQRLIFNHGLTLAHWPDLVEAARSLKARGRGLAEEVP